MSLPWIDSGEILAIGILVIVLIVGLAWLAMRVDHLERRLSDGPSHKDLADIRDRLADLSGHMTALGERQTESTRMIRTIQKHLMESDP